MIRMPRPALALFAGAAMLLPGAALSAPARPQGLAVERVVIVMRHGIRAPLAGEVPEGIRTAAPWPRWPVSKTTPSK